MSKCFISYSWDDESHKNWVKDLASSLRSDGIETVLDQWHLYPGDPISQFMEKSISENDFVLIICTPKYKSKSNNREGGVGYEGDIITAELFSNRNQRKFIPILRVGTWSDALPTWLNGKLGIDLSKEPFLPDQYADLVSTLHNIRETPPPVGMYKSKASRINQTETHAKSEATDNEDIKINGILVDEVTIPKNDGTRGSALYSIPFKLNRKPSNLWARIFVEKWKSPPSFTSMHRPNIASVSYDKIVLNGTTIDEVKKYHRDTLVLVVEETNKIEREYVRKEQIAQQRQKAEVADHKNHISSMSDDIEF